MIFRRKAQSLSVFPEVMQRSLWKLYHFHPYSWQHLKPIVSCASSVAVLFFLKNVFAYTGSYVSILLFVIFFMVTYVLLLKILGFTEEDKVLFDKIKEKIQKILGTGKYIAIS
jgi:hypothetical protein